MNLACLVGKDQRAEFEQGVFRAAAHFDNNFTLTTTGRGRPMPSQSYVIKS